MTVLAGGPYYLRNSRSKGPARTNRHHYRVYRSGDRMGGETQGKPLGRHKPAGRGAVPCVT